jgi:hypothetical protein
MDQRMRIIQIVLIPETDHSLIGEHALTDDGHIFGRHYDDVWTDWVDITGKLPKEEDHA